MMQTMAPPENAEKERFARIDQRFDEVNRRITEGREETIHRFDRVEGDVKELRKSVHSVQTTLNRVCIGLSLGFASALLAILTKGG
jgi:hypothetical protein